MALLTVIDRKLPNLDPRVLRLSCQRLVGAQPLTKKPEDSRIEVGNSHSRNYGEPGTSEGLWNRLGGGGGGEVGQRSNNLSKCSCKTNIMVSNKIKQGEQTMVNLRFFFNCFRTSKQQIGYFFSSFHSLPSLPSAATDDRK